MAGTASGGRSRSKLAPWLLCLPALAYLTVFFVVPVVTLAKMSLSEVSTAARFDPSIAPELTWRWGNYSDAFDRFSDQIIRSFTYAGIATVLSILLGFPLAYVIAFKAGRLKNLLLGLVILPFFVTFLVRTIAWTTLLSDDGVVVSTLNSLGLPLPDDRILATSWGVVFGLTYNFLPFMVLPIYVSLEKIDPRLLEAGRDLYGTAPTTFRKVVLPLALPGLFAGSLLTFIPAAGDFVNATFLGNPETTMIGNVVQDQFYRSKDYPTAAAISFLLMAIIAVGVLVYSKVLGTEELA
jgi:spermidine/putrescine transport system permease protein